MEKGGKPQTQTKPESESRGTLYRLLHGQHVQYGPLGNDTHDGPGPNHTYRAGDVFYSTHDLLRLNGQGKDVRPKFARVTAQAEAARDNMPKDSSPESVSLEQLRSLSLPDLHDFAAARGIDLHGSVTTDDVLLRLRDALKV